MQNLPRTLAALLAGLVLLGASPLASAVPSFARQTGMPCSGCHTTYPELTQFGRSFKLTGYTLSTGKQIQAEPAGDTAGLKIGEIPPLSAMVQVSATHMQKSDPAVQNDNFAFPQEASLFFAGAISERLGAFVQVTYAQDSGAFEWDDTDVRYANNGGSTVWGLTFNNNPSVQDLWNTTPAWGFPFARSGSANTPAAATLVDGGLGGDVGGVGGVGAYAMFANHVYAEVTGYRSTHQGEAAPSPGSTHTISGLAPYWRLAWQQSFGADYLMVGGYGLMASIYSNPPSGTGLDGISGPRDKYNDYAFDTQYEHMIGSDMLTVRGTWIHEKKTLDASFASGDASNASDTLSTARINTSYHFGQQYSASLAYFQTTGSDDLALNAPSSTGAPDSRGEILQGVYLPWQNVQALLQYTVYNRFDGARSDYDGSGRSASDNNTLYALLWLMW